MYVMEKLTKWEDYLHLVEVFDNNGLQAVLGMSPLKVLYGMKYRTLINWVDLVNRVVIGLDMLKEMEKRVVKIRW